MNLYDIITDLFAYLIAFRLRVDAGVKTTPEEVQKDLLQIFREQEVKVRQNPALIISYNQVKYPLVVFADDMILNSNWEHARGWEAQLIERHFFESDVGGDRFFEQCEELEMGDPDVASIFYICLSMGFRGRYEPEADELRLIKQDLRDKCNLSAEDQQEWLSPEAYAARERRLRRLPRILRWRQIAIVFIVLFGLYIILDRIVIWQYVTASVSSTGNLSAIRLATGDLPTPVRLPSTSSRIVPPPMSPESELRPSQSIQPVLGDDGRAAPEQIPGHKVTKKIDFSSLKPEGSEPVPAKKDIQETEPEKVAVKSPVLQTESAPEADRKPEVSQEVEKKAMPAVEDKKQQSFSEYTVQVGAYRNKKEAEAFVQLLKEKGYDTDLVLKVSSSGKRWHLIQMGRYKIDEFNRAEQAAADYKAKEQMDAFVARIYQ